MIAVLDAPPIDEFAIARRGMIDSQLRPSGVNQPAVLEAMGRLARENYVPEGLRHSAYADRAIALGGGHWLAAPVVHGRMLCEAAPAATETVLLIDGGSG